MLLCGFKTFLPLAQDFIFYATQVIPFFDTFFKQRIPKKLTPWKFNIHTQIGSLENVAHP